MIHHICHWRRKFIAFPTKHSIDIYEFGSVFVFAEFAQKQTKNIRENVVEYRTRQRM